MVGDCAASAAAITSIGTRRSPGTVTVPHPKKDLGVGLVRAIRKLAGV
jgi:hypothetical protein